MDTEIRTQVDRLLLEQGEYLPLELLLTEGRLDYADYEAWRGGEAGLLEERLFGDADQIKRDLLEAAAYAKELRLEPETLDYEVWGGGGTLRFSRAEMLDALFRTAYRRPADAPQTDLFMDSPGTALVNDIVQALGRRDLETAQRQLQQLYRSDPGNTRLGGLERLLEAAQAVDTEVGEPAAELARLRDPIQPLAEELLGRHARAYLLPLWRRLHQALAGQPFDPGQPDLHRSHTAGRMLDWKAQLAAVEAEPQWREQPLLLQRHAAANLRLRDPRQALADLFRLCWRFPQQAASPAAEWPVDTQQAWERFQELDPELETAAFPAWLLIIRPGLADTMAKPSDDAPESYRLLYRLQREQAGNAGSPGAVEVRLRGELKQLDPAMFRHYLANRGA